jgi:hypothetical protein
MAHSVNLAQPDLQQLDDQPARMIEELYLPPVILDLA